MEAAEAAAEEVVAEEEAEGEGWEEEDQAERGLRAVFAFELVGLERVEEDGGGGVAVGHDEGDELVGALYARQVEADHRQ